jgi:hypothetical protein
MRQQKDAMILPCPLSDEELKKYGMRIAELEPKIDLLDNELKEFKDQVNANKSKIRTEIMDLSNRVNLRKEYREVTCNVKYDFERGDKIWLRLDTGEIVKKEDIPAAEMQEVLPLKTPTEEEGEAA